MIGFDADLAVTNSVLDAMAVRAKVILHNLANQNTPGFKRYEVRFESLLREAHARGDRGRRVDAVVERDMSGPPGVNNVSLLEELALLDKVHLVDDVFGKRAASYFRQLNRAIAGR
jgi:hypothetical protein